jgi:hypothetical protein
MTTRARLPNRRASETFELQAQGIKYRCTYSRYESGVLAEIFIASSLKAGSQADVVARDSAVVASIALQFGVPVDVLRHALSRNADGSASGPLGVALDLLAKRVDS